MLTEKEIIEKIKNWKEIKPDPDWVFLTKKRILAKKEKNFWRFFYFPLPKSFQLKPGYISLVIIFILIGLFGITQNSLPGDFFYPIKKIAEKSQVFFVPSPEQQIEQNFESVSKRLEELEKIAQKNQTKKLIPGLKEYQESVEKVAQNLTKITASSSKPELIKKIAKETQKLEESKTKLEKTYGIVLESPEEESNPTKILVEWLIKDLENKSLTKEQLLIYNQAKEDFENKDYNGALTKLLSLSYPQE